MLNNCRSARHVDGKTMRDLFAAVLRVLEAVNPVVPTESIRERFINATCAHRSINYPKEVSIAHPSVVSAGQMRLLS
jgi:hypothetical protein